MQAEQRDIASFLSNCPPFNYLEADEFEQVLSSLEVQYFKAGSTILEFDQQAEFWYFVRKGSVEVRRRDGELYNKLSATGYFGEFGLLMGGKVRFPVKAREDALCYLIPADVFKTLFNNNARFADHVEIEDHSRLKRVVSSNQKNNLLLTATLEELLSSPPLIVQKEATAQEVAILMGEQNQTCAVVCDQPDGWPIGIVTDQDFRQKLIASGQGPETPVAEIMTPNPRVLSHTEHAFEAMLVMLRSGAHHLPVSKNNHVVGVLSQTELVRYQSQSSLFLVNQISMASDVEELAALKPDVSAAFIRLVQEHASARMIGASMASIGRSFKQRLLELAEERLGSPPVPYAFLALGSMARQEQLLLTDQDNALVLSDQYIEAEHSAYFEALAQFVCDGLDACGYPYCTGGIMATNPSWRQPLAHWKQLFQDWINKPSAQGLLNSSIFFDLECVWGEARFATELNALLAKESKNNKQFLACMSRNALLRTPPLGFFRDFVVEKDGSHMNTINIKRRGTAPMTDLIRVHALANGSLSRNSFSRLEDLKSDPKAINGQSDNLHDALEVIYLVRIEHQAKLAEQGLPLNNQVDPKQLTLLERRNLKDAFQVLSDAQGFLKFRHQSTARG